MSCQALHHLAVCEHGVVAARQLLDEEASITCHGNRTAALAPSISERTKIEVRHQKCLLDTARAPQLAVHVIVDGGDHLVADAVEGARGRHASAEERRRKKGDTRMTEFCVAGAHPPKLADWGKYPTGPGRVRLNLRFSIFDGPDN